MALTRININGIHELDFTLPGTTTASVSAGITSIVNAGFNGTNKQTGTSYTVQSSDNEKLVTLNNTSAVGVTLPQAGTSGIDSNFVVWVSNQGTGTVTITPTTSTIDGSSTLTLSQNQGVIVFTDAQTTSPYAARAGIKRYNAAYWRRDSRTGKRFRGSNTCYYRCNGWQLYEYKHHRGREGPRYCCVKWKRWRWKFRQLWHHSTITGLYLVLYGWRRHFDPHLIGSSW